MKQGEDLTTYGELCAEGTFRAYGAKALRHVFLFDKMLLIAKKKEDVILSYKTHIMVSFSRCLCHSATPSKNDEIQKIEIKHVICDIVLIINTLMVAINFAVFQSDVNRECSRRAIEFSCHTV